MFCLSCQNFFGEGELKRIVTKSSGLEGCEQRILFKGKEREDNEFLHIVGVKDASKVVLMEGPTSRERKMEKVGRDRGMTMASEAVMRVRAEVDKLSEKVIYKAIIITIFKYFLQNLNLYFYLERRGANTTALSLRSIIITID